MLCLGSVVALGALLSACSNSQPEAGNVRLGGASHQAGTATTAGQSYYAMHTQFEDLFRSAYPKVRALQVRTSHFTPRLLQSILETRKSEVPEGFYRNMAEALPLLEEIRDAVSVAETGTDALAQSDAVSESLSVTLARCQTLMLQAKASMP